MKVTENCTLLQLLKVESEKLTNYQQSSQSSRKGQAPSLEDFDFRPVFKNVSNCLQIMLSILIQVLVSFEDFRMEGQSLIPSSRSNTAVCSNQESRPKPKTTTIKYGRNRRNRKKHPQKYSLEKNVLGTYRPTTACRNKLVKSLK